MATEPAHGPVGGSPVMASLAVGRPVLSLGVRFSRSPDIARMAAAAGYGVLWIDLEHSGMPIDCACQIAATGHDLGLASWVRVPERELGVIGRLLDGGATGIIVPKIETVEEAREVARFCRFPPAGARSQIAQLPQFGFRRMAPSELTERSNAATVVQILIESAAGIANADAIASVPGVNLLGIGMNDLTADLGCPGDPQDPRALEACRTVAAAAARHGKLAVVGGVGDAERFAAVLALGFAPLIFAAIDTELLAGGLAQRADSWRGRLAPSPDRTHP
ncbi:HpcH/HpaI aldolase family protein [Sphingomonas bacterium]|uniref:HpcH/HpaI aldolase family protein n=1 Tax=Sphingomonas bacterium TaxID=1895847 RepID=UPI001575442E|nr:aldolase/citrate lyase family protein [Sphingomonas bacterium]